MYQASNSHDHVHRVGGGRFSHDMINLKQKEMGQ